jgi:hypothetical protein
MSLNTKRFPVFQFLFYVPTSRPRLQPQRIPGKIQDVIAFRGSRDIKPVPKAAKRVSFVKGHSKLRVGSVF